MMTALSLSYLLFEPYMKQNGVRRLDLWLLPPPRPLSSEVRTKRKTVRSCQGAEVFVAND